MIVAAFTFFFPYSGSGLGSSASNHKALRFLHIGICKRPCASATINICVWPRRPPRWWCLGLPGNRYSFQSWQCSISRQGIRCLEPELWIVERELHWNTGAVLLLIHLHEPHIRTVLGHSGGDKISSGSCIRLSSPLCAICLHWNFLLGDVDSVVQKCQSILICHIGRLGGP